MMLSTSSAEAKRVNRDWFICSQPKEVIAEFVANSQGSPYRADYWGDYRAIGYMKRGSLVAGVIYNQFEGMNVCAHIGSSGSRWLARDFLFAMFDYPFREMDRRRFVRIGSRSIRIGMGNGR